MYKFLDRGQNFICISLSKEESSIDTNTAMKKGEEFARVLARYYVSGRYGTPARAGFDLQFHLLEIKGVENPSEICLVIERAGAKSYIPLFKYRPSMIYQANTFILDIKGKSEFQVDLNEQYFSINAIDSNADENFEIKLYGEFIKQEAFYAY